MTLLNFKKARLIGLNANNFDVVYNYFLVFQVFLIAVIVYLIINLLFYKWQKSKKSNLPKTSSSREKWILIILIGFYVLYGLSMVYYYIVFKSSNRPPKSIVDITTHSHNSEMYSSKPDEYENLIENILERREWYIDRVKESIRSQ